MPMTTGSMPRESGQVQLVAHRFKVGCMDFVEPRASVLVILLMLDAQRQPLLLVVAAMAKRAYVRLATPEQEVLMVITRQQLEVDSVLFHV